MPGNTESIPRDTEMIPGVHINVILIVQLQMKPQRKTKSRYSTEANVVVELRFWRDIYKIQTSLALLMAVLSMVMYAIQQLPRKHGKVLQVFIEVS